MRMNISGYDIVRATGMPDKGIMAHGVLCLCIPSCMPLPFQKKKEKEKEPQQAGWVHAIIFVPKESFQHNQSRKSVNFGFDFRLWKDMLRFSWTSFFTLDSTLDHMASKVSTNFSNLLLCIYIFRSTKCAGIHTCYLLHRHVPLREISDRDGD